jgi:hypothetical protein
VAQVRVQLPYTVNGYNIFVNRMSDGLVGNVELQSIFARDTLNLYTLSVNKPETIYNTYVTNMGA